ncbi:MAG: DUF2247 family protein [Nitrospirae bacterium]|nr:DUF2247 family protein [Nitrospirota bacterium]
MTDKQIPISFIKRRCQLSWQEAAWGYEHKFLGWKDIIELARSLADGCSDDAIVIVKELSSLDKDRVWLVGELLNKLAASEQPESDEHLRRKWLYLVLARLFDRRRDLDDPLGEVEAVYADFDYPSEIEGFVRYMPVSGTYDPAKHPVSDNESRLFMLWEEYLDRKSKEFGFAKKNL